MRMRVSLKLGILVAITLFAVSIVHADSPNPHPDGKRSISYDVQAAHAASEGAYFWIQVTNLVSSGYDQFKIVFDPAFTILYFIDVPLFEYHARLVTIPIKKWSTESSWVFAEFCLVQDEKMLFLFSAPDITGNYSVYHFLFYKNDSANIDFPMCVMSLNYTHAIENVLTQKDALKTELLKQIGFQNLQIQLMEKMFNFSWSKYANDPSGYVNSLQHQINETAYWKVAFSKEEMKVNLLLGAFLLGFGLLIVSAVIVKRQRKNESLLRSKSCG
jgi:hypothetical protein